ncbi:hypothetical protein TNCV_4042181 [Trichonephila clavipes]|nr:hypothetical protein TNCV_4042181 [Trichonephila clavipes]
MAKRKREITGDAARRRKAIRTCERRAAETVEEIKKRLETEGQKSRRLAAMAQRDQERRAEETEEQRSY